MQRLLIFIIICLSAVSSMAQTAKDEAKLADNLKQYFLHYKPKGTKLTQQPRMLDYQLDKQAKTLTITADEYFSAQEFTPDITERIYKNKRSHSQSVSRISDYGHHQWNGYRRTDSKPTFQECGQVETVGRHRLRRGAVGQERVDTLQADSRTTRASPVALG